MNRTWTKTIAGGLAGTAATLPMSMVMLIWHRKPWRRHLDPLPPKQITSRALDVVGVESHAVSHESEETLSIVNHFAYGAAMGTAYGAIAPRTTDMKASVATGVMYGLGVWAGSYLGWLPATGMYKPVHRDSGEKTAVMIAAHVVWGGVLGFGTAYLAQQMAAARQRRIQNSEATAFAGPELTAVPTAVASEIEYPAHDRHGVH